MTELSDATLLGEATSIERQETLVPTVPVPVVSHLKALATVAVSEPPAHASVRKVRKELAVHQSVIAGYERKVRQGLRVVEAIHVAEQEQFQLLVDHRFALLQSAVGSPGFGAKVRHAKFMHDQAQRHFARILEVGATAVARETYRSLQPPCRPGFFRRLRGDACGCGNCY